MTAAPPAIADASDSVTILRACGRRLAKTVCADGRIIGYDQVRTVDLIEMPVRNLYALERLLRRLETRADCCIVRGRIADPSRTKSVRRLLYRDPETGDEPTLQDAARRWVALDFDDLPRPAWIEPADLLGCACVAIRTLPKEFHRARFIVQATASHGLKPGIRIRLWAWLSRGVSGGELRYWLRSAPVDPAVFGPAQIIYTAAPVFLAGAFDPLPVRLVNVPGDDVVIVPPPDLLKSPPRPKSAHRKEVDDEREQRAIAGLVRSIAQAVNGNRNACLYWASRVMAEKVAASAIGSEEARSLLEQAAVQAGLSALEAAATVRSGLRHGGE